MLSRGLFGSGQLAEIRKRMSDYIVDGRRLGEIPFEPKSGSANQPTLSKGRAEVESAAFLLSGLGHESIRITTVGPDGSSLERPDLDAEVDGSRIGIEVVEVTGTIARMNEAQIERVGYKLLDLRDADYARTTRRTALQHSA